MKIFSSMSCTIICLMSLFRVDAYEITHPMTVINKQELDTVKMRIVNNVEPQKSAFVQLMSQANAALSFSYSPPTSLNTSDQSSWVIFKKNGDAAYSLALAYVINGDKKYADKALDIMDAWALKNTTFGKTAGSGLHLGSFRGIIQAADLLHDYPGWDSTRRARFKRWWTEEALFCIMLTLTDVRKEDGADMRPEGDRTTNWTDNSLASAMATAIAFDDKLLLDRTLVWLKLYYSSNNRFIMKTMDDGKTYAVAGRDIDRHKEGLIQGVMYTGYGHANVVQALEMARYCGVYLWKARTPAGVTEQAIIENYFRWNFLKEPFPLWTDLQEQGWRVRTNEYRNIIELYNNHFTASSQMKSWLSANRPVKLSTPGDIFITLTKGDIKPEGTSIRFVPGPLSHSRETRLQELMVFNARGQMLPPRYVSAFIRNNGLETDNTGRLSEGIYFLLNDDRGLREMMIGK